MVGSVALPNIKTESFQLTVRCYRAEIATFRQPKPNAQVRIRFAGTKPVRSSQLGKAAKTGNLGRANRLPNGQGATQGLDTFGLAQLRVLLAGVAAAPLNLVRYPFGQTGRAW